MKNLLLNIENKLAFLISGIFHPLITPTYLFLAYFRWFSKGYYPVDLSFQMTFLIVLFVVSFLFPIFAIFGMFFVKKISSMMLFDRKERYMPFLITLIIYIIAYKFIFCKQGIPWVIPQLFQGILFSLLLTVILNYVYKISAHSVSVGGVLGMFFYFSFAQYNIELLPVIISALIISGAVLYSRLILSAHNNFEIYTGLLIGFLVFYINLALPIPIIGYLF